MPEIAVGFEDQQSKVHLSLKLSPGQGRMMIMMIKISFDDTKSSTIIAHLSLKLQLWPGKVWRICKDSASSPFSPKNTFDKYQLGKSVCLVLSLTNCESQYQNYLTNCLKIFDNAPSVKHLHPPGSLQPNMLKSKMCFQR